MAVRQTLINRPSGAPLPEPIRTGAQQGAFGDYRGLQQFGRGVENVGGAFLDAARIENAQFSQREEEIARHKLRLKEEHEQRERANANMKVMSMVANTAAAVKKEIDDNINTGKIPVNDIMTFAEGVRDKHKDTLDKVISSDPDPYVTDAADPEKVDYMWGNYTNGTMVDTNGKMGVLKIRDYENTNSNFIEARINLAGNDPKTIYAVAMEEYNKVIGPDAGMYSRDYQYKIKEKLRQDVSHGLHGAVIDRGGVDEELSKVIEDSHEAGFVSTNDRSLMYKTGAALQKGNQQEANKLFEETIGDLKSGKLQLTPEIHQQIMRDTLLDPNKQQTLLMERSRQTMVANTVGAIAHQDQEGQLAFPMEAKPFREDELGNPQRAVPGIYEVLDILKQHGDPNAVRDLMEEINISYNAQGEAELYPYFDKAAFTDKEVEDFRKDAYDEVSRQLAKMDNNQGNEIAQRWAPIQKMIAEDRVQADPSKRHSPEEYKDKYIAWNQYNNVKPEKWVLVHAEDVQNMKAVFKRGNADEIMANAEVFGTTWDMKSTARAFDKDPEAQLFMAIPRALAQLNMTDNELVKEGGIRTFARWLTESAVHEQQYGKDFRAEHKEHFDLVEKYLSIASLSEPESESAIPGFEAIYEATQVIRDPISGTADALVNKSVRDARKRKSQLDEPFNLAENPDGDMRLSTILNQLANESPAMAQSLRQRLIYGIVKQAYWESGNHNLVLTTQQITNSVFTTYLPIRLNGMYSPNPSIGLVVNDMQKRDYGASLFSGPKGGQAVNPTEAKFFTTAAFDAVVMDGRADVSYGGLISGVQGFGYIDDFLASTKLQDLGYRAEGYKDHSMALTFLNDPDDSRRVPLSLRIPYQDLVLKNERDEQVAISKDPVFFNTTFSEVAKKYVRENIRGRPGMDKHSLNFSVFAKNIEWRETPTGDYAAYLRPESERVETTPYGAVTGSRPVYKQVRDDKGNLVVEKVVNGKKIYKTEHLTMNYRDLMKFRDFIMNESTQMSYMKSPYDPRTGKPPARVPKYGTDRDYTDED